MKALKTPDIFRRNREPLSWPTGLVVVMVVVVSLLGPWFNEATSATSALGHRSVRHSH